MPTFMAIAEKTQTAAAMKRVIDYVMQDYKTIYNGKKLVSGQNCIPQTAYTEFMATKNQYRKAKGVFFKQYVQSFKPGTVSPETIHQIGIETAKAFDGFEVVIATHIDKDHWHNHFVVNSVNCENGLKIQINEQGLENLRDYSDKICQQFGVEILKPYEKPKEKSIGTKEYRAAAKGESWKFALMATIDKAMKNCRTKDEFKEFMKRYGYDVKWHDNYKYITYTCPNNMKCRDIRLHQEKYRKEKMELEFRYRELEETKRQQLANDSASGEYNDSQSRAMASDSRFDDKSFRSTRMDNSKSTDNRAAVGRIRLDNRPNGKSAERDNIGNSENTGQNRRTGWESEREYLYNNRSEQNADGGNQKEVVAADDWNTVGNTNPVMDGIYTIANAAEIIRKPTRKPPRTIRNKKKALGQRDDDHSGDYVDYNTEYYGQSM